LSRVPFGGKDEEPARSGRTLGWGGDVVKVWADNQICEAHGQCAMVDEELFPLDEDGYSALGGGAVVPPGKEETARVGVDACPLQALHLD
jgi:ferredoxin